MLALQALNGLFPRRLVRLPRTVPRAVSGRCAAGDLTHAVIMVETRSTPMARTLLRSFCLPNKFLALRSTDR